MRGTAWYANLAGPLITHISPLRSRIGVGSVALVSPPNRKMASWPKLGEKEDSFLEKVLEES